MSRKTKEAVQGIIYILPSFVLILIFCIIPIFMSGYFSFTEYNIMNAPPPAKNSRRQDSGQRHVHRVPQ